MKKNLLIALTFVPIASGLILNLTVMITGLGTLLFYLIPLITLVFWLYLGSKYSETGWNILQSTIISNSIGVLSLIVYLWQFWGRNDDNRNLFLATISQLFVASTNLLTAKYALIFESEKNNITQISSTAMQIMGLLLMVIVFMAGYILGKIKAKQKI